MTDAANPIDPTALWIVIISMALGSFALRFLFIGLVGDRPMPEWFLRHLRYTAVAIIPALVTPLVVWPAATDGVFDLPRVTAAVVTVAVGLLTRSFLFAVIAGTATLYGLLALLG